MWKAGVLPLAQPGGASSLHQPLHLSLASKPLSQRLMAKCIFGSPATGTPTRALIACRDGHAAGAATLELVKEARSANKHVPAILAGTRPPAPTQDGYVTMGGPDEATDYLREFGQAWKDTPGAVDWLAGNSDTAPPKRRSSKRNT